MRWAWRWRACAQWAAATEGCTPAGGQRGTFGSRVLRSTHFSDVRGLRIDRSPPNECHAHAASSAPLRTFGPCLSPSESIDGTGSQSPVKKCRSSGCSASACLVRAGGGPPIFAARRADCEAGL